MHSSGAGLLLMWLEGGRARHVKVTTMESWDPAWKTHNHT